MNRCSSICTRQPCTGSCWESQRRVFNDEDVTHVEPQLQLELPQPFAETRTVTVEIICETVSTTSKTSRGRVR